MSGESLVGEMMSLEVIPDHLDVVEFGRIFRLPLDREPVGSLGERRQVALLTWIGPLSSTMTTGLMGIPGFRQSCGDGPANYLVKMTLQRLAKTGARGHVVLTRVPYHAIRAVRRNLCRRPGST
jgi:hypothetical protein